MMNKVYNYTKWILSGAAIGATLALLSTPTCGKETRRRLSRWARGESGHKPNLALFSLSDIAADETYSDADIRLAQVVND
jgi:gas vesicle protein